MHKYVIAAAASLLTTGVLSAQITPPAPLAADPELAIDAFLPALITGLKRNLSDAYSVRDLTVCDPHKVDRKEGRVVGFAIRFALNSKNEAGGYTGLTTYAATFKNGRAKLVFATTLPSKDAFDGLLNREMMKRIAGCRSIPQATVQALLESSPAL